MPSKQQFCNSLLRTISRAAAAALATATVLAFIATQATMFPVRRRPKPLRLA